MSWRPAASGSPIASGRRRHTVLVEVPNTGSPSTLGSPDPRADGDAVEDWQSSPPSWQVAIEPATTSAIERIASSTVVTNASHIVTGPYRSDVTTLARLIVEQTRYFNIVAKVDPEDRHRELILFCQELADSL